MSENILVLFRAFSMAFAMVLFHVATAHPNSSRCLPGAARGPVHSRGEAGRSMRFEKVCKCFGQVTVHLSGCVVA